MNKTFSHLPGVLGAPYKQVWKYYGFGGSFGQFQVSLAFQVKVLEVSLPRVWKSNFVQVLPGKTILQVLADKKMLQILEGKHILQVLAGKNILQVLVSKTILQVLAGKNILFVSVLKYFSWFSSKIF